MEKTELDMIIEEMQKIVPNADFDGLVFNEEDGCVINSNIAYLLKNNLLELNRMLMKHNLILFLIGVYNNGLQFEFVRD